VTNDKRVEEIRERLAKATPAPWHIPQAWAGFSEIRGGDGKLVFGIAAGHADERQPSEVYEANAALIAAGPSDLAFLLSELDRAKKLLTLAVGVMANECALGEMAFKTLTECRECVADATTENKSNG
jgi:hypothetical protein